MEKRLLLFLVLTFLIIIVWSSLFPPVPPPKRETAGGTGTAAGTAAPGGGTGRPEPPGPGAEPPAPAPVSRPAGAGLSPQPASRGGAGIRVGRDDAASRIFWTLDPWGGSVRSARLKEYTLDPGQDRSKPENWFPVVSDRKSDRKTPNLERGLVLRMPGEDGLPLDRALWEVLERGKDRVVFRLVVPGAGVVLTKEYRFPRSAPGIEGPPNHLLLRLGLTVTDAAKAAAYGRRGWTLQLQVAGGTPVEPFSFRGATWASVMVQGVATAEEIAAFPLKKPPREWPKPEHQGKGRYVEWVGVKSRYFTAILKVGDVEATAARRAVVRSIPDVNYDNGKEMPNLAPALEFTLPLPRTGETVRRDFLYYVGPMDPSRLSQGPYGNLDEITDYGFFGPLARIIITLLGVIQAVVGNWGLAIIVLTLLIRGALFPLSKRSQISMQRYQRDMMRLKPKMDAVRERHKGNKKKMNEELMKLYREEGVRPLPGGCLVMFLQFPIFIGLYVGLQYSLGLRHAPFLWATDLTAPDRLLGPFSTKGIPLIWDPFYLNVFPILMGITWYVSSAMAPKPQDPQQQQTMKFMKYMPVLFALMLYNYSAGLSLYMIVTSTWSIFETKYIRKKLGPVPQPGKPAPTFRKGR